MRSHSLLIIRLVLLVAFIAFVANARRRKAQHRAKPHPTIWG